MSATSAPARNSASPAASTSCGTPAAFSTRRRYGDDPLGSSCAGMTRASINLHKILAKKMDGRVKPGHDGVSITLPPRQLIGVKIAVAEQFLADPRALHEEADVELVGHAHAAVHLHAFLDRERRGRAGLRLCDRHGRAGVLEIAIQRLQRLQ